MKRLLTIFMFSWQISSFLIAQRSFQIIGAFEPLLSSNITIYKGWSPDELFELVDNKSFDYQGYAVSLAIRRKLSSKVSVQTGLGYLQSGFITYREDEFLNSLYPIRYKLKVDHQDIVLPCNFRYDITSGKNKFYLISGISPVFRLSRSAETTEWYEDGRIDIKQLPYYHAIYKKLNFNFEIGLGYEYYLSKKVDILIQPTFRSNILGSAVDNVFLSLNRYVYSFGVSIGLVLK